MNATSIGRWDAMHTLWAAGAVVALLGLFAAAGRAAAPPSGEPELVDVFEAGKEGYPHFRIPSIVTAKGGVLLAIAEGRQGGDHSENDIVLKRSTDGGKTWGEMQVVHEDGKNVLVNPCAVVLESGRVLLMFQRFKAGYHARAMGSHVKLLTEGIAGETVSTTLLMQSDDKGKTWSAPRDVTAGTKRPTKIISTASGPGRGIVLCRGKHAGRILMPTNEGWWEGKARFFNVYACYSDDGGESWKCGEPAPNGDAGNGNEVQMVELADGSVLLNSRSIGGGGRRKLAVSADGGQTWSPLKDHPQLPEPQCMGSVLRLTWPGRDEARIEQIKKKIQDMRSFMARARFTKEGAERYKKKLADLARERAELEAGGKSRILYAGPASRKGRVNGTVRMSCDEGRTWPVARTIYAGGYAYSCLTALPDGSVGVLFEKDGYKTIAFARFTVDWLTEKGE